ncbi:MAG: copper chaperone PCu(A)C [Gammaproteobacteria bacterium]|nr:copper chaperone PCu(A)C [Gammaproteobacteria bacterium]
MNLKSPLAAVLLVLGLVLPLAACSSEDSSEPIKADNAWARATPPGSKMAAVYVRLVNPWQRTVSLLGFQTERAASAHLHETRLAEGMSRMQSVGRQVLQGGESLVLAPGGMHIMLMGLESSLIEGQVFSLQIRTDLGDLQVPVHVKSMTHVPAP